MSTRAVTRLQHSCTLCSGGGHLLLGTLYLHHRPHLVGEGNAGLVECSDERVGKPLQLCLVTDKHLTSICHCHSVKSTATMHTERTAAIDLQPHLLNRGGESGWG